MTSREHIKNLIGAVPVDHCGFWLGKPQSETIAKINATLGTHTCEEIQQTIHDDIRWITPQYVASTYRHPEGKSMRPWKVANPHGLSGQGLLSAAEDIAALDTIDFPEARFLDFTECLQQLGALGDVYRLSGFWSPFFHDLSYLFGTEELLVLMLTEPEVVQAATERICTFYYEANELFFPAARGLVDALFIGNDFGTQNGLLMSPAHFREFFLPWIAKFAAQAHRHKLHFILHCCGSIPDIIEDLIAAGVDCLHPLQTRARAMEPECLAPRFNGRITFMGGVDTQNLLQNGTPADVDREIQRLLNAFGTRFILGPSHEALLPDVSVENVLRMARYPRRLQ
jgi:uroporphyrinogen decarboxylase